MGQGVREGRGGGSSGGRGGREEGDRRRKYLVEEVGGIYVGSDTSPSS